MMEKHSKAKGSFARLWQWVKDQIIGEVPEGSALCEYDCRKIQCTAAEWATCDRRLDRAAGELMPARSAATMKASLARLGATCDCFSGQARDATGRNPRLVNSSSSSTR